jgi:hypothetical protein
MCLQCDGYSYEQSMLALDLTIRTYGWQLTQVTDANPWSYTIGLTESYGHPELMIVGLELDLQNTVIRKIVDPIVETGSVDCSFLEREGVTLVEVHPNHLAGDWFGTWSNFYERTPPPGSFLQIVPPGDWFCECHQHSMPHFELPGPIRFDR